MATFVANISEERNKRLEKETKITKTAKKKYEKKDWGSPRDG
jgi:hypothetical protein